MKSAIRIAALSFVLGFSCNPMAAGPIDGKTYGKINISMVNDDQDENKHWQLDSNASRFGFAGKTEITDSLFAIYKAEFEMYADDGNKTSSTTACVDDSAGDESCRVDRDRLTLSQRNIMLGIKGNFGTIWAGKHDSPTKLALSKVDLFNDLQGDVKHTFEGENRLSNLFAYTSPDLNGLSATIAIVPGEGSDIDGNGSSDTGIADGMSYSVSYSGENLYLALAGDQDVDKQDLLRLIGRYKIDSMALGFMLQQNENDLTGLDESGYFLSASYQIENAILKAQYGRVEDDSTGNEEDTLSVGADYKLSNKTKLFVFYTKNEGSNEQDWNSLGLGMEHKF
ncbi:MAG: hypothetical protein CMK35_00665 [Porticoccaceae bacterium]|nr:hypothetical protein [Porticoccaceae bacterium]